MASQAYGGFWIRLVAYLIDGILVSLVTLPLAFVLPKTVSVDGGIVWGAFLLVEGISIVLSWVYFAGFESSSKQGTLGKMIFGLKVTSLSGERISFARATGRYFAKILSGLTLCIGFLMIAFTEKKQGLHDMLAGTLVTKKSK